MPKRTHDHRLRASDARFTRYAPESDRKADIAGCPLCAISCREHMQQRMRYSITSSARASSEGGTVRPSIRAVSALITSSNLVACATGMSAGCFPRSDQFGAKLGVFCLGDRSLGLELF